MDNVTIKEILGSFICRNGMDTLQFIVGRSSKNEIILFYINGKSTTSLTIETTYDDVFLQKEINTEIITSCLNDKNSLVAINLNKIYKPEVKKENIEELFNCKIIEA